MSRLLALSVLLTVSAQTAAAQTAGVFTVEDVFCDCDPRDTVLRTTRPVVVRAQPSRRARVVRTVAAGRLVEGNDWTDALTVVEEPERLTLTAPVVLYGVRRFAAPTRPVWENAVEVPPLTLTPGTRIDALPGEGGGRYIRTGGTLYYVDDFDAQVRYPPSVAPEASNARRTGEAAVDRVWFRLRPRDGRPAGWIEVPIAPTDAPALGFEVVCETHSVCPPGVGRRR